MKTETQIAEENIEQINDNIKIAGEFFDGRDMLRHGCFTHKASSQRFLEFSENITELFFGTTEMPKERTPELKVLSQPLIDKIQDLKQAIKLYEENGI